MASETSTQVTPYWVAWQLSSVVEQVIDEIEATLGDELCGEFEGGCRRCRRIREIFRSARNKQSLAMDDLAQYAARHPDHTRSLSAPSPTTASSSTESTESTA